MCARKLSWALISILIWYQKRSWALMSSHDLMAQYSWLLFSSHECSLLHGAKLMSVHGCSWVLIGNQEHSWLLLAAYECSWVLMGAHECSWLLMSTLEQQWTLLSLAPWSNEHTLELNSSHEHGPRGHGRSSALMSAHGIIVSYSWVILNAYERKLGLISTHERSWELIRAELLY